jgi:hypothetical protein
VIASTATSTSRAVSGAMGGSAQAQQQQVANAAAMQSQAEIDQLKAQMDVMQMQQTLARKNHQASEREGGKDVKIEL